MALEKAAALGMAAMPLYAASVAQAQKANAELDAVRGALREGIEAVALAQLTPALERAAALGLTHYEQARPALGPPPESYPDSH